MSPEEIRRNLAALLDDLERLEPGHIPRGKVGAGESRKVPIVRHGEIIGYSVEPLPDYREEEVRCHHERVRELRRALQAGGDPYLIWLALAVGGGAALPDVRARQNRRSGGRKARLNRIDQEREGLQVRNIALRRKLTRIRKARDYHGESFAAVCKLIAKDYTQHGLEHLSGKQVERICADLRWTTRQRQT